MLCARGTYSSALGVSVCLECVSGKYLDTEGNDAEGDCILCGKGKYSGASGARLQLVHQLPPASTWTPRVTQPVRLCTCGLGTYSATGESSCVLRSGKYLTTEGNDEATDCELCGTGTYSAQQGQTSAATCVACPAGKYAATLGMSSCTLCGAGKYLTTQGSMERRIASCAALAPTPHSKDSRRQQRVWTAASANTLQRRAHPVKPPARIVVSASTRQHRA